MNELEEAWSKQLASAIDDAKKAGRHDIADFLTLKAENDSIRMGGVKWLFETFVTLAAEANREFSSISMERTDPHNFPHRGANIVGTMLRIRCGVRCLTFEAGWTRTPSDGFLRGGALAFAKITHFGMPREGAELNLVVSGNEAVWKTNQEEGKRQIVDAEYVRRHLQLLVGDAMPR